MIRRRLMLAALITLSAISTLTLTSAASTQANVTLGWNASSSSGITGYKIYVGGASSSYTNFVSVGNVVQGTVPNLVVGGTYYFAVTAVDVVGLESPYSGQISYTVPAASAFASLKLKKLAPAKDVVSGTAPAGYVYSVFTSRDLKTWSLTGSVTANSSGILSYTNSAATNRACYYRLQQTSP